MKGYMITPIALIAIALIMFSFSFYYSNTNQIINKGIAEEGEVKKNLNEVQKMIMNYKAKVMETLYLNNKENNISEMESKIENRIPGEVTLGPREGEETLVEIKINQEKIEQVDLKNTSINLTSSHPYYHYYEAHLGFNKSGRCQELGLNGCSDYDFIENGLNHQVEVTQVNPNCTFREYVYDEDHLLTQEKKFNLANESGEYEFTC